MTNRLSFLSFPSRYQEKSNYPGIVMGDNWISSKSLVHNLGVIFDHSFTGEKEVNNKIRQYYYHIKNIGKTRNILQMRLHTFTSTKTSLWKSSSSWASPKNWPRNYNERKIVLLLLSAVKGGVIISHQYYRDNIGFWLRSILSSKCCCWSIMSKWFGTRVFEWAPYHS